MYKASADINRQLIVLSAYVLSASNVYVKEIDIKELLNADWMSVKLKEEIKLAFMIK